MNLKIAIIGNKAWTSEVSALRMNKMDCGRIPWTLIMMIKRIILTMVMMIKTDYDDHDDDDKDKDDHDGMTGGLGEISCVV